MVGAASNTGVVGCKAGLPVHGIIGDASLIVSGTGRARSERDSELVPSTIPSTYLVSLKTLSHVCGIILLAEIVVLAAGNTSS